MGGSMKILFVIIILLLLTVLLFTTCSDKPNRDDIVELIYLPFRDVTIEKYFDRSGGAYASSFLYAYIHYKDGSFKRIYSMDRANGYFSLGVINLDSFALYISYINGNNDTIYYNLKDFDE
jgi:hypothetical protein